MRLKKFISIIMVVLLLLPAIPTYAAAQDDVLGVMFSWSDNDSEFIAPFEEGKTLSYYTNKMQSVPAQDGMKFVGWKLHGTTELLNDGSVITADMRDADTPDIVWIEAVFEEEQTILGVMFSWSDNDSEFIAPFEEGKTLSYYADQMQSVPAQDGMNFVGWKLHGTTELLNDNTIITADMCDAETPEIVWIEAVFEGIIPEPDPSDKEDNMDWYWNMIIMLHNTQYDVTATAGEGGSITNEGISKVKFGNSITYIITPDAGYKIESVKVNGKEMGAITEYTFKNVRSKQNISATFKKVAEPEWANPFTDISKSDDYYAAIEFVYENKLFKGTSDTTFAPNTTMSRGMFVTVLGRLAKVDVSAYTDVAFDDVIADQYYAPYVAWAVENGMALGYGDGTFGPDDEVTIEQAIVFIARFAKLYSIEIDFADIDFTAYTDANDVSEWAFNEMLWALEKGIYDVEKTILNPQGKAARWLVADMIYNFCNVYLAD